MIDMSDARVAMHIFIEGQEQAQEVINNPPITPDVGENIWLDDQLFTAVNIDNSYGEEWLLIEVFVHEVSS